MLSTVKSILTQFVEKINDKTDVHLKLLGDETVFSVINSLSFSGNEFSLLEMNKLNVKKFESANREWLKFIIENRMNRIRQHNYDVVIGPTANDDTRTSIRTVMNASNGAILSDTALDLLIVMLEPNNLPEQYYFGTEMATAMLKLTGRRQLK